MAEIWYEKKEFVKKAINMNFYGSKIYLWCDVGTLRAPLTFDKQAFGELRNF